MIIHIPDKQKKKIKCYGKRSVIGELELVNLERTGEGHVFRRKERKEMERELAQQRLRGFKDYVGLQGALIFAQDNLREIIEMISASKDSKECIEKLCQTYHISVAQGQAILDMRLKALTDIEKRRMRELYQEYQDRCKEIEKD